MTWFVYILNCADKTFYTGITTNLARRESEHNSRLKGAKYTRARQPVRVVYHEVFADRSSAQSREATIKKLTHKEKEVLID